MINLLKETLQILVEAGKTPEDVCWVGGRTPGWKDRQFFVGTWTDFAANADFEYDNGYGVNEINGDLYIVGDNWWLERGEYDGSEWWEFKTLPSRPDVTVPFRPADLRSD